MEKEFSLSNFDFSLPPELIAQEPLDTRDDSRLLIVNRQNQSVNENQFKNILDYLKAGDVLVLNNTKVMPVRLFAKKKSGAKIEILLLKETEPSIWEALIMPSKRLKTNDEIIFENSPVKAIVLDKTAIGARLLKFSTADVKSFINQVGLAPTPPYIKKEVDNQAKYQTVYAKVDGAIAAPTAGFHFTPELLKKIQDKNIAITYVTLHCSLATFRPVKTDDIRDHVIESEYIGIDQSTVDIINKAKKENRRIVGVGTTSIRTLESVAFIDETNTPQVKPFTGETKLYITPGYKFKIIDAVITNFHTPHSTNLVLVSCFASIDLIQKSYNYAIKNKFRFFSFGDAMLIL